MHKWSSQLVLNPISRSSLPVCNMDAPASSYCSSGLFWTISCRGWSGKKSCFLLVFPTCTRGMHARLHEALHLPPSQSSMHPSSLPIFSPNSPSISCLPIAMHPKLDVEVVIAELRDECWSWRLRKWRSSKRYAPMTATRGPHDAGVDGALVTDGEFSVFRAAAGAHDEGFPVTGVGDGPNSGDYGIHDRGS